jgi:hypothetical protein
LTVEAWAKKGFRLSEPETWDRADCCGLKLIWTPALHDLRHDLQQVAHCSAEQAKNFTELVLGFVHRKSELAYSMVGILMAQIGINGKSHGKQKDVLNALLNHNAIHKTHNHFHDKTSGYRHGAFYIVNRLITFEGEGITAGSPHTHTVSIDNLPLSYEPLFSNEDDVLDFVTETRRLNADRLFRERHKQVKQAIKRVA